METKKEIRHLGWFDLVKGYFFLLGPQKNLYLFWDFCLILLLFYTTVPPLILGLIVDFFGNYQPGQSLQVFYFYIAFLGLSFALVSYLRLSLKNTLSNARTEIAYGLKVTGFDKLMDFSVEWHDDQMAGEKSQRIVNGISAINDLSMAMENIVFQALASFVGIVAVFLFLQPTFVLFFLLYLLLFFANLIFFNKRIQLKIKEQNVLQEKSNGAYVEGLNNLLTIKTLGANKHFLNHIESRENAIKKSNIEIENLIFTVWKIYQALNGFSYAFFLFLIGQSIVQGVISPGTLVIFYGYLQSLIGAFSGLMDLYDRASRNRAAIERMLPIYQTTQKIRTGRKAFPKNWEYLTINAGSFAYGQGSEKKAAHALSNIDLTIRRGAKIGLVGASGSGKSTLVKMLMGLYEFSNGTYQIGGVSFYEMDEEQTKKQMSLVLQDSEMFNMSLLENITLLKKLDWARLKIAVDIAQLADVIKILPQGFDTLIGEKGYHLSGGERQRIGIARAIYRDPEIMIFDESTSSLDGKTEARILTNLEKKLKNKTIIFIAHKVASLRGVDQILVFNRGQIVEEGPFNKLAGNKKSIFNKIYATQLKK